MTESLHNHGGAHAADGFTLIELLMALAITMLLLSAVVQLSNNTGILAGTASRQMEVEARTRTIFDRMQLDFAQIVQRPDVDCFLKSPANPQPGNDRIAFYCQTPGYSASNRCNSPLSLVAYRVGKGTAADSHSKLQRTGIGLQWNGASDESVSPVFLPMTIAETWPAVTAAASDPSASDEPIGPGVFRFEYCYYLLKGKNSSSLLSAVPWDVRVGHTSLDGFRDVATIVAVIAVIDGQSEKLVSESQLQALASNMDDFSEGMTTGDLVSQWTATVAGSSLPAAAKSAVRVYFRPFALNSISR